MFFFLITNFSANELESPKQHLGRYVFIYWNIMKQQRKVPRLGCQSEWLTTPQVKVFLNDARRRTLTDPTKRVVPLFHLSRNLPPGWWLCSCTAAEIGSRLPLICWSCLRFLQFLPGPSLSDSHAMSSQWFARNHVFIWTPAANGANGSPDMIR